jgi:ParB/RepB/Spo0J family partition protein
MLVALKDIRIDDDDLRYKFDVKDLRQSMDAVGQITPITVRQNGDGYVVVAGRRRMAAAVELGWVEIEAYVLDGDTTTVQPLAMQVVENVVRADFTPYELAQGVLALKEEAGLNQADIGAALNMTKTEVARFQKIGHATRLAKPAKVDDLRQADFMQLAELGSLKGEDLEQFTADFEASDWPRQAINKYAEAIQMDKWLSRREQKLMVKLFDDIGAVPMDPDDIGGSVRLHGGEIETHRGNPCHGWIARTSFDTFQFVEYCLDPSSHTDSDDSDLQNVATLAVTRDQTGMNAQKAADKARRAKKAKRKDLVVAFAQNPATDKLRDAIEATLLTLQQPYRWNELGKTLGLVKPSDQIHFDFNEYLDKFAGRERQDQALLLAIGSVYIQLNSYSHDSVYTVLEGQLDELFGYEDE